MWSRSFGIFRILLKNALDVSDLGFTQLYIEVSLRLGTHTFSNIAVQWVALI